MQPATKQEYITFLSRLLIEVFLQRSLLQLYEADEWAIMRPSL